MANRCFESFIQGLNDDTVNWTTGVNHLYAMEGTIPDVDDGAIETIQDLIDAGSAVVASAVIANPTQTNRDFGGDDPVFSSFSGNDVDYFVAAKYTNTPAVDRLVYLNDTTSPTVPYTPLGVDTTIRYADGPTKIVSI